MITDFQCFSRIIHLASQLQLGNWDVIDYYIKSYSRFIFKHGRMHLYEKASLGFFQACTNATNESERRVIFQEYLSKFKEIVENPLEYAALHYFDMIIFIESLLQFTSISELKKSAQPIEIRKN